MSFEIHFTISEDSEQGQLISSLSTSQHITPSEAVEQIVSQVAETQRTQTRRVRIPGLPSEPLNDDECAMMDEIVAEAMEARVKRLERYSRA